MTIDPLLLQHLACPRDQMDLEDHGSCLRCAGGHEYSVVDGVPVFLLPELENTLGIAGASYHAATTRTGEPLYLDTLGLNEKERTAVAQLWESGDRKVDPAIAYLVGATSGYGYIPLMGKMQQYPIPNIPLPPGHNKLLLDVGCNWGRWSVSAARNGWRAIGIDPSLGAILASKRAFHHENLPVWFVCGDARALPFKPATFDTVYSYSVIQHFSEINAELALREVGRVLTTNGNAKIQMAQKWGLRSTYIRTRPNYPNSGTFRVRYWTFADLRTVVEKSIGPCRIDAEGFGGLGLLPEDFRWVSLKTKLLILASLLLRTVSRVVRPLSHFADSVFVTARKQG